MLRLTMGGSIPFPNSNLSELRAKVNLFLSPLKSLSQSERLEIRQHFIVMDSA